MSVSVQGFFFVSHSLYMFMSIYLICNIWLYISFLSCHLFRDMILSSCCCYYLTVMTFTVGAIIGPSLAIESDPVAHQPISSLADTAYPKQNQYFDSTNMAYVLELSNSKTNQNNGAGGGSAGGAGVGGDEDDEDDNSSSNDGDNIRTNQKYVNVSSRDNRNFYNNHNHNIGDDADKMNNALNRGPFFDVSASKNVTALVGKTANLNCRIKNLGNKTVSKHRSFAHFTILNDIIAKERNIFIYKYYIQLSAFCCSSSFSS